MFIEAINEAYFIFTFSLWIPILYQMAELVALAPIKVRKRDLVYFMLLRFSSLFLFLCFISMLDAYWSYENLHNVLVLPALLALCFVFAHTVKYMKESAPKRTITLLAILSGILLFYPCYIALSLAMSV